MTRRMETKENEKEKYFYVQNKINMNAKRNDKKQQHYDNEKLSEWRADSTVWLFVLWI